MEAEDQRAIAQRQLAEIQDQQALDYIAHLIRKQYDCEQYTRSKSNPTLASMKLKFYAVKCERCGVAFACCFQASTFSTVVAPCGHPQSTARLNAEIARIRKEDARQDEQVTADDGGVLDISSDLAERMRRLIAADAEALVRPPVCTGTIAGVRAEGRAEILPVVEALRQSYEEGKLNFDGISLLLDPESDEQFKKAVSFQASSAVTLKCSICFASYSWNTSGFCSDNDDDKFTLPCGHGERLREIKKRLRAATK